MRSPTFAVLRAAAIFSVVWFALALPVVVLSVGFAGGVGSALESYWIAIRSGDLSLVFLVAPVVLAPVLMLLYFMSWKIHRRHR